MRVYLVNTEGPGVEELSADCKIVMDLGPSKSIELHVARQRDDVDFVVLKVIGGVPAAKRFEDTLKLEVR